MRATSCAWKDPPDFPSASSSCAACGTSTRARNGRRRRRPGAPPPSYPRRDDRHGSDICRPETRLSPDSTRRFTMSLSRRDFLKYGSATATGVAVGGGIDLAPVEAAATSLKIKEAKAFAGVCPYCAVGCGQLIYAKDNK